MRYLRKIDKLHEAVTFLISIREITGTNLDQNISCHEMFLYFPQSHNGQYLESGLGLCLARLSSYLLTVHLISQLREI